MSRKDLHINKIATTHGLCYTPEHAAWNNVKSRCNNPNNAKYYMYGAVGIKVCDRWNFFENFICDMGNRPSDNHSLDRIDGKGNYEPSNCRWATKLEQATNLKSTKILSYNGKSQSQAAWARELGISAVTLRERLQKWTLDKALSTRKLK